MNDDEEDGLFIEIQNAYYEGEEARDNQQDRSNEAIEFFKQVISLSAEYMQSEGENKGEVKSIVFQATRDLVLMYLRKDSIAEVTAYYRQLMGAMGGVARSDSEGAINKILDTVEKQTFSADADRDIRGLYEMTLKFVEDAKNESVFLKTSLKFGNFFTKSLAKRAHMFASPEALQTVNEIFCSSTNNIAGDSSEQPSLVCAEDNAFGYLADLYVLDSMIRNLKKRCLDKTGKEDWAGKSTHLMEIYYLEIQLCSITNNIARLCKIYPRKLFDDSNSSLVAVVEPKVLGGMREEGGKMYMSEKNWDKAFKEFRHAFFSYQQTNSVNALRCLKYTVFASMFLSADETNLLTSKEAKVYIQNPEIQAMDNLKRAKDDSDLVLFENILKDSKIEGSDPFLKMYVMPLRRSIRERVLINKIQPYVKVGISFLSQELSSEEHSLSPHEVRSILIDLIVSQRIKGFIDDVDDCLVMERRSSPSTSSNNKYKMMSQWVDYLSYSTDSIVNNV
jgi:COP9 signalosome complex subunit 2